MRTLVSSRACKRLGCALPIVLAGMGGVARAALVDAVSRAGGFGFLGMVREPPDLIVREVERLRTFGHRTFGVNIIPAATEPALLERQVACCINLAVPVVGLFWDIDAHLVRRLRDAGILVVQQVGSVEEAMLAESVGADMVIVQGREAGGHVRGRLPLATLLPQVVDAIRVPVLAAGGLARGADLVTARALGAEAIVIGTALIATREAFAHPHHKRRLLDARADDTVLTDAFHLNWPPDAPVRVLKSEVTSGRRGDPFTTERTIVGEEEGRPIYLFSTDSPLQSMTGEVEAMALYCGTGVEAIKKIVGARERVCDIFNGATSLLASDLPAEMPRGNSSPVCYAHEMSGAYMGYLDPDELAAECATLARDIQPLLRQAAQPSPYDGPPFSDKAATFARWALILREAAGDHATLFPCPQQAATDPQALLKRLGLLIPRVDDLVLRGRLTALMAFLEAERLHRFSERRSQPSTA